MKIVLFYHSLLSDWNHGNAHFLRGIVGELKRRGHEVRVLEPRDGWSLTHLIEEHGLGPVEEFYRAYPGLASSFYDLEKRDWAAALDGADLVIVHEWNDPELVRAIGEQRKSGASYVLFFHDTHHRSATDPESLSAFDLSGFDGVLAYGRAIAHLYIARAWARRVWIWHEAADTRVFRPLPGFKKRYDLVWIGNWGDEERAAELYEYLIEPVQVLKLKAVVYGVRYPRRALEALEDAGIEYGGWLPNFRVPEIFAGSRLTLHVHRRPYVEALPGIPTIRPFEALACGIPLICSPWNDGEGLFRAGKDYLVAHDGAEMKQHLRDLLDDPARAQALAAHGRRTLLERHTAAHRVDQLLQIYREPESTAVGASATGGVQMHREEGRAV